jgi:hypothetical protein
MGAQTAKPFTRRRAQAEGARHFERGRRLLEAAIVEHRHAVSLSRELAAAHGQLANLLREKGMRIHVR